MAASLIVARVDGMLHQSGAQALIVQGTVLTPPATLLTLNGARLVLADGTVLMIPAGQPMQLALMEDGMPTLALTAESDIAASDPDVAALQQAIAQGEDPTLIQQAPAAGIAANGGGSEGGSLAGDGGAGSTFDITRTGREEQTAYTYQADFTGTSPTITVAPNAFSPNGADNNTPVSSGGSVIAPNEDNSTPAGSVTDNGSTGGGNTATDPTTGADTPSSPGGESAPDIPATGETPAAPPESGGAATDPTAGVGTPPVPSEESAPDVPATGETPAEPPESGGAATDATTAAGTPSSPSEESAPDIPATGETPAEPPESGGAATDPTTGAGTPSVPGEEGTPELPSNGDPVAQPALSIALDPIAADNIVNATESVESVPVSGRAFGSASPGDTVSLTIGNTTLTTTLSSDRSFSLNVPGAQLANDHVVTATVTHFAEGGALTSTVSRDYQVDIQAPEVSITLAPITGDNLINVAEADGPIAINGYVGGDVVVGDTVIVTIGAQAFTTHVIDDLSFNINVPAAVFVDSGDHSLLAIVSKVDAAGNVGTATASQNYSILTTPPALSIQLDTLAGDNIVNADEVGQTIPVTGTVSGEYAAGDIVTLTVGDQRYTGAVNADGSFSIAIPGSQLAQSSSLEASISHTDAAGNIGSTNTAISYGVDVDAPVVAISLDTIAGDDVINAAETEQDIAITGTAGGDTVPGDTVTISVGGQSYTTVVGQNGTFSVAVPGAVLAAAGTNTVSASVSHTDVAGNVGSATTSRDYSVDTTPPALSITLDTIAGDNIVNADEAGQTIPVTGTVSGEYAAGDTVTLTIGNQSYIGAVNADGTFSINVPGSQLAQNSSISAAVSHTDAAGNIGSANTAASYGVDTGAPVVTISLDSIAGDDVINAAEAGQDVAITGQAGGDAVAGDTVTVSVGGQSYTTPVGQNGTFSVSVAGSVLVASGTNSISASVSHTDAAGNVGAASTSRDYSVDTTPPALNIQLDTLVGDNIVNADEANQTIPVTGSVVGEYAAGDLVTLTVGDQVYTGAVNADGSFAINVPGSQLAQNGSLEASISHTDAAGNVGSANTAASYGVDAEAPIVAISLDTIAGDDVLNATESGQDVAITGQAGGDAVAGDSITVSVGGQSYTTTVGQNGAFSVAVPGSVLAQTGTNTVSASVSHVDAAGNTGSADTSRDYTVDTTPPALSITLDTIAGDNIVNADEAGQSIPVTGSVSGEYAAGDFVTLTVGLQAYTGAINADGSFSIAIPGSQLAQSSSLEASISHTDAAGNIGSANTAISYGVDVDEPVVTISLDTIGGDDVINAAEAGQDMAITGQAGGEAVPGDTVTVSVGGQSYTTPVGQNGGFSVAVPGAVLATAGTNIVNAFVSHADAAGNVGSANTAASYSVDTDAPEVSITLDTIAGDDVINAEEAGQSIPVTGTVGGEYVAGDTVTLTVGNQTYTGAVNADGTFSINVPGSQLAQNTSLSATVSHTDAAGNVGAANAATSYSVDTDAPVVSITLDTIAGDDVLNAAEAGQTIPVTGIAGGDAVPGDVVTVNVGVQSYTTTVGQSGTFSVAVSGSVMAASGTNSISASVSHTDAAGNVGSATTSRDYSVDTTPPALNIQLDTLAGDNIVNADEANQTVPVTGTVVGEYAAGDLVTLTVGSQSYTGAVNADGSFAITVPGNQLVQNGSIQVSVSHTDAAGNIGSANTATSYSVDTDAPVVSIALDTIAGDDVINAAEAEQDIVITGAAGGDAAPGDTVTINVGGQNYTTTVGQNGAFSVAVAGSVLAAAGTNQVSASISHTDTAGNSGSATTARSYEVDILPPEAIADTAATQQTLALVVDAEQGVLANDSDADSPTSTLRVIAINDTSESVGQAVTGSNGGTFMLGADGSYRFEPGNTFDALPAGETTTTAISYTVSDAQGNASISTLTVTVTGTNDLPTITGQASGDVTERSIAEAGGIESNDVVHSSGSLADVLSGLLDINLSTNTIVPGIGTLGVLSIDANGHFDYRVDGANPGALLEGEVRIEAFEFTDTAGGQHSVTVALVGTAEGTVIGQPIVDALIPQTLDLSGELALGFDVAVDPGAVVPAPGTLGTLTINADGSFFYQLAGNSAPALAQGEVKIEAFTYADADGNRHTLTIDLLGTGGVPIPFDPNAEAGSSVGSDVDDSELLTTSGTLNVADVDTGESVFLPESIEANEGTLGALTITSDGQWTYRVDNDRVRYLGADETKQEIFTVRTVDGTSQTITVTVHGANSTAEAIADTAVANEDSVLDIDAASGVLVNDIDPDAGAALVVSAVNGTNATVGQTVTGSNGGTFVLNADGSYRFDPGSDFQALAEGSQQATSISYSVSDGQGSTTTSTLTVTVEGRVDAPVVAVVEHSLGSTSTGLLDASLGLSAGLYTGGGQRH